jgi:hypothetical protein
MAAVLACTWAAQDASVVQLEGEISSSQPEGCPTMRQAYVKFKGDMSRLQALHAQAEKRARDAEASGLRQREAAKRCLAAQKLLSGPVQRQGERLQATIRKAMVKSRKIASETLSRTVKRWKEKLKEAVSNERSKTQKRINSQLKQVKSTSESDVSKWKQKYKLLVAKTKKITAAIHVKMVALKRKLATAERKVLPVAAAVMRTRKEDKSDAQRFKKYNAANQMAANLLRVQLRAKTKEAASCAKALKMKQGDSALTPAGTKLKLAPFTKPCEAQIANLESKIRTAQIQGSAFKKDATSQEQHLASTKVLLDEANARIADLEKQLRATQHNNFRKRNQNEHHSVSKVHEVVAGNAKNTPAN